MDRRTRKK